MHSQCHNPTASLALACPLTFRCGHSAALAFGSYVPQPDSCTAANSMSRSGRELPRAPRTDPDVQLSAYGSPPWVSTATICCRMRASIFDTRMRRLKSGACVAGPHSPWSPPFAPPAPQRIAPLCLTAALPRSSTAPQFNGRCRKGRDIAAAVTSDTGPVLSHAHRSAPGRAMASVGCRVSCAQARSDRHRRYRRWPRPVRTR